MVRGLSIIAREVFTSKRLRNGFTSLHSLGSLLKQNNVERIGVLRQGFGCEFLGKMTFMGSVFFEDWASDV